jgi:hypothetical protein
VANQATVPIGTDGSVTAWPSDVPRHPLASNVNVTDTGQTTANHATVLTGHPDEAVTLYTADQRT